MSDYTSRTNEASELLNSKNKPTQLYAQLSNIFYSVSYAFEAAEFDKNIDEKIACNIIRKDLAHKMDDLRYGLEEVDMQHRIRSIADAGLSGIFEVAQERFKDGAFHGNGHHAMQEASANALIRIDQSLRNH